MGTVCLNLLPAGDQQPEDELKGTLNPEAIFRYTYEEQIPAGRVNKGPSRSFVDDLYVLLHLNILMPSPYSFSFQNIHFYGLALDICLKVIDYFKTVASLKYCDSFRIPFCLHLKAIT